MSCCASDSLTNSYFVFAFFALVEAFWAATLCLCDQQGLARVNKKTLRLIACVVFSAVVFKRRWPSCQRRC